MCYFLLIVINLKSFPVAELSKARVCGRWLAGIVGSNLAGGMDVCVVCGTLRTKHESQDNQDKEVRIRHK